MLLRVVLCGRAVLHVRRRRYWKAQRWGHLMCVRQGRPQRKTRWVNNRTGLSLESGFCGFLHLVWCCSLCVKPISHETSPFLCGETSTVNIAQPVLVLFYSHLF